MFSIISLIFSSSNSLERSLNLKRKYLVNNIQRNNDWKLKKEEIEYYLLNNCINLETWITIFKTCINPEFSFYTYLQDPNEKNQLYIFLENSKSKQIENYTINYTDFNSVNDFFTDLFNKNDNSNKLFEEAMSFSNNIILYTKTSITTNAIFEVNVFKYNFLHIFTDLTKVLKALDYDHNILTKNSYFLLFLYNTTYNCLKCHKHIHLYVTLCQKIILEKYQVLYFNISENSLKSIILKFDIYLNMLFKKGEIFNKFSKEKKLLELYRLSKCLYTYIFRFKYTFNQIFYFVHAKISNIEDKLIKMSLILSFVYIQTNVRKVSYFPKISKLIIFIYAFNTFKIKIWYERRDFIIFLCCLHKKEKMFVRNFNKFDYLFYPELDINKMNFLIFEMYHHLSCSRFEFKTNHYKNYNLDTVYNRLLRKIVFQSIKVKSKMYNFSF